MLIYKRNKKNILSGFENDPQLLKVFNNKIRN